ncbi:MAG: hypothetical protein EPO27_14830 [Betaproteobacteria bacterium]|nr:MAG: hypothetical protein EPO27_14830 [Betaproteobacteria bacterium]
MTRLLEQRAAARAIRRAAERVSAESSARSLTASRRLEVSNTRYSITQRGQYLSRELEAPQADAANSYPAIVLTGPRRAGKTWFLKHLYSRAHCHLFKDPNMVARFRHDPQGFLDGVRLPAILDEI